MWFASVRDLQWRRRRFVIGVVGTALVFGVTLLMAGLSDSLRYETKQAITATGADAWVVPAASSGPLTSLSVLPAARADEIRSLPGVRRADPVLVLRDTVRLGDGRKPVDVVLLGHVQDGLGAPAPARGRPATTAGEVVVDTSLGANVDTTILLSGRSLRVTGVTRGTTMEGGIPMVFVDLTTLQQLQLGGAPVAMAVLVDGAVAPEGLPADLRALSPAHVTDDLLRRLGRLVASMDQVKMLLWGVAAAVVGSLVYLTALERTRDFAAMKATGASSASLFAGVALQAVVLALTAAALAAGIAKLLIPTFPVPLLLSSGPLLAMPVVAMAIGLLASAASLRRVISVDPVAAFGQ